MIACFTPAKKSYPPIHSSPNLLRSPQYIDFSPHPSIIANKESPEEKPHTKTPRISRKIGSALTRRAQSEKPAQAFPSAHVPRRVHPDAHVTGFASTPAAIRTRKRHRRSRFSLSSLKIDDRRPAGRDGPRRPSPDIRAAYIPYSARFFFTRTGFSDEPECPFATRRRKLPSVGVPRLTSRRGMRN